MWRRDVSVTMPTLSSRSKQIKYLNMQDGRCVHADNTPEGLGMEDGDIIETMMVGVLRLPGGHARLTTHALTSEPGWGQGADLFRFGVQSQPYMERCPGCGHGTPRGILLRQTRCSRTSAGNLAFEHFFGGRNLGGVVLGVNLIWCACRVCRSAGRNGPVPFMPCRIAIGARKAGPLGA